MIAAGEACAPVALRGRPPTASVELLSLLDHGRPVTADALALALRIKRPYLQALVYRVRNQGHNIWTEYDTADRMTYRWSSARAAVKTRSDVMAFPQMAPCLICESRSSLVMDGHRPVCENPSCIYIRTLARSRVKAAQGRRV
jgi:hypothetical protein